jgi:Ala-tRNA(Pro) deacylase
MKQKIFDILDELKIEYTNYEHDEVFTCDEAKGVDIPGQRVKSLLLRNKKATNFYMIVLPDIKQLDTNMIRAIFDDSKMSFASPERMMDKI